MEPSMPDATNLAPKYDRQMQLRAFAAEMQRTAAILEREIKAEEDRARRYDPTDVTYPLTAKAMRNRRQKISFTIATLQRAMEPSANAA
jgi:hypothetical protein